ncbi:MAG: aminotransferase DegT [Desulfurococcales archaeon ex4484_42]|nr:MAG: aminotransferase DegT [Desulfurococcales archaeon ex4484_42]
MYRIKVNQPFIEDDEIRAVIEVLKSGYLTSGKYTEEFEREFARYLNVRHVVTVSNGTIALYLAYKVLGIGPGDEVLVPDFTFIATASMAVVNGAKPVFVDIDPETYTMDPHDLERKITERSKVIVPVHLFGHPAPMDEIIKIARERGIYVIEDCAQAHGAEYRGIRVGSIGDLGVFSFYATKNLTMGEGGAIATSSDEIAEQVRLLRNHGQSRKYHHIMIGWNFRITELQAALGLQQLRKLDRMNKRRREIAKLYLEELSNVEGIRLPVERPWAKHVYHQFTIWVKKEVLRDKLREYLARNGVQTSIHYPEPLHIQPAFKGLVSNHNCCPNAVRASRHVLSLPMHPGLKDEEVMYVAKLIKEYFKSNQ